MKQCKQACKLKQYEFCINVDHLINVTVCVTTFFSALTFENDLFADY